jgi:tRNA (guanine-N7-)-methyltransferase
VTQVQQSAQRDLRTYGRRRGRVRSRRQQELWTQVLPRVALPACKGALGDTAGLFSPRVRDTWLEIGFGGGEHLIWQAAHNPDIGVIGCEPFEDGVVKVLATLEAEARPNLLLWPDDARPLLRQLPRESLGRVFILFPDPWPKKRHHKRRLITTQSLEHLAGAMRAGAELRIATDIGAYANAILLAVSGHGGFRWVATSPADWRYRRSDWPPTRYESKALAAGRRCYYLRFERI